MLFSHRTRSSAQFGHENAKWPAEVAPNAENPRPADEGIDSEANEEAEEQIGDTFCGLKFEFSQNFLKFLQLS